MKRFATGVVIGKFLPLHRGHHFLIETALSQCEIVTVIVCWQHGDPIRGDLRGQWLRAIHPTARVMVVDDTYGADDSQLWGRLTIAWLGGAPDAVFTSEPYGDPWAAAMGATHVCVDLPRQTVPICATTIRAAPLAHLEWLHPIVRAHFVKRVCVLGAESTGTTTLSQALAILFCTNWVAEYGREYCEKFWTGLDYRWQSAEFEAIAREQSRRENEAAQNANRVLICDTNAFATRLWHERYLGFLSPQVEEIAARSIPDLYILTGDEIPFVQDGLRDGEAIRHMMQSRFREELRAQNVPWLAVSGAHEARLEAAALAIEEILAR